MIKPEGIPIDDVARMISTIDKYDQSLRTLGPQFTQLGQSVNSAFKGLDPVYQAPEKYKLVSSMQIVETKLNEFGPTLPQVANHLRNLAGATQEKLTQLKNIRTEAYDWHRRKNGNPEWQNDQAMIDDNNRMVKDVTKIMQEELPAIAINAANAIAKLYGGKAWDPKTGQRDGDPAPPKQDSDKEPDPPAWGTEEERDKPWWQDCLEFPQNVVIGVLTVVGETVQSILTLVPVLPALGSIPGLRDFMKDTLGWDMPTWKDAGNAWVGLGKMVAAATTAPIQALWAGFDAVTGLNTRPDVVKEFGKESLDMGKNMLKGFVAWDEWSKNPGKAFGMALTNVVATVASGGAAGGIKAAAMAGKFGAASVTVAKVAGVAEKLQVARSAIHDATLGAVTKIPKVGQVVTGMSKIPIVGENFKMQNLTKVEVPKVETPHTGHASAETPHASVDTPSVHTASVDTPTVHTPTVDNPTVHTSGADGSPVAHAGPSHTDPGTSPVSHSDPGTPSVSHADPGTPNTPGATTHTPDPGTPATHTPEPGAPTPAATHTPDPGTHTPESLTHTPDPGTHTPGATHTPDPNTPGTTHTPDPNTPGTTHTPDPNTPGTTHTPDPNTPGSTHTPDPNTPGTTHTPTHTPEPGTRTPESTHTPEPGTRTPESTHTPEATTRTPESTHTPDSTHTPESTRTPESTTRTPESTTHTPESTRTPESTTRTPESTTHTPESTHTPEPTTHTPEARTHTPDSTHTPENTRTPESTHTPESTRTPESAHTPDGTPTRTPDPVAAPIAPMHPGVSGHSTPSGGHHDASHEPNQPHRPAQESRSDVPRREHDGGNDPKYDDPKARQAEIDRLKPDYLKDRTPAERQYPPHSDPNRPQDPNADPNDTQVDRNNFLHRDPHDPRRQTLRSTIGDPPEGSMRDWVRHVNPDHGRGPEFGMNCADCSRKTAAILNGDVPELANGRRLAHGEPLEPTLEWMGLKDFSPGNKLNISRTSLSPGEFTEAAFRRVHEALEGRPPGTHANLFVRWHSGHANIPGAGHVLNAVVDDTGVVRIVDSQPTGGMIHEPVRPDGSFDNPYKHVDPNGDVHDVNITEMQFAVRERGGHWEGVPAEPNTPARYVPPPRPANAPHTPAPSTSHTPAAPTTHSPNPPDPHAPNTSGSHPPEPDIPGTPASRPPETHSPEAHQPTSGTPGSHDPQTHAPESGTPESHDPRSHAPGTHDPRTHARESGTPESHDPRSHAPGTHDPRTHARESRTPESHDPRTHAPESRTPESHDPRTHAPESGTPQSDDPRTHAPETRSADGHVPGSRTPDAHAPDGHAREPHAADGNTRDATESAAHTPEGRARDPHAPDTHTPEAHARDGRTPEAQAHDGRTPEAHAHDGRTPEATARDGHAPEQHAPEARPKDGQAAGSHADDAHTPGQHTPGTHAPDGHAPETHAPDGHGPETHAPDGRAPEGRTSEVRGGEYGSHQGAQHDPFAGSELADRRFRASERDLQDLRAQGGMEPRKLAEIRGRLAQQVGDANALSDIEVTSLERMLIGHDHQDVNTAFREGDRLVEQKPVVRVATSALNKLPDYHGELQRGLSFYSADEFEAFLNRYRPGQTAREPAFTHSAKGREGAEDFSGGRYSVGRVVLHIDAQHGKDLSFMRDPAVGIDEVMHGPHTPFYPTRMDPPGEDGVWHIHVRDHGGPVDPTPRDLEPISVDGASPRTPSSPTPPWSPQTPQPPANPFGPGGRDQWTPPQPHTPTPPRDPQPTYNPGQQHNPTQPQYNPGQQHNPGQPTYNPGQQHNPAQPAYNPGQQHNPGQPTYNPGQPSYNRGEGQPYNPGEPQQPSGAWQQGQPEYRPGPVDPRYALPGSFGPQHPGYNPETDFGPRGGQQPGEFPSGGYDPRQQPAYDPRQPQQPTYDPRQPQQPTYDPRQPRQPEYDPRQQPGYDPRQQAPAYDPRQAGYDPRTQQYPEQPGYAPHQQPVHDPRQPQQPGYEPQGGFGPRGHQPEQPGFGPTGHQPEPGYGPGGHAPHQQPGYDPRQPQSAYDPRQQQPGYDPREPQQPTYDPRQPQQSAYDPRQPQQPTYDPRQPQQGGYEPRVQEYPSRPGYEPQGGFGPVGHQGEQSGFGPTGHQPEQGFGPVGHQPGQPPYGGQPHGGEPSYESPYGGQPHGGEPSYGGSPRDGQAPYGGQPGGGESPHGVHARGEQPFGGQPAHGGQPGGQAASGGQDRGPADAPHETNPAQTAQQAGGEQGWRGGDPAYGISDKAGFDPAFHHKALGEEFAPGVQDAGNVFSPKERAIGDRLAEEGWRVDARRPDHTVDNLKNPECMLRKDGTDEGLIAEYKTLESDSNNAVKRNINAASEQVPADGEVVIDGRAVGLTEENAARAWKRAVLQQQKTVASAVHIILGDGRMVTYVKES